MNDPAALKVLHTWLCSGISTILFSFFGLVLSLSSYAEETGKTSESRQNTEDSSDWIFDQAPYTNNPRTGDRVWQYKKEKTPYRDPYSVFDSPHESFPFDPDGYDSFFYGYPYYSLGMWPYYSPYFYGTDASELFPYDGDPND